MKCSYAYESLLARKALERPMHAALRLADKAWVAASPVVAKGCIAAIGQPSPTAGFMLAVGIELGRRLLCRRRFEAPCAWPILRCIAAIAALFPG
jgi:hypothetical protein